MMDTDTAKELNRKMDMIIAFFNIEGKQDKQTIKDIDRFVDAKFNQLTLRGQLVKK